MKNLQCIPIFGAKGLNCEEKLTHIYFGVHFNKYLLLSKSKFFIKLIVLKTESNVWELEFIQNINNYNNKVMNAKKVVSMGDLIILLDEDGNLWKLVNQFKGSEKEEYLRSLDEYDFYLWVPFTKFEFINVRDIKAIKNNLFCIGITSDLKIKFQVVDSENILLSSKTILENLTQKDYLNFCMEIIQVSSLNFNYAFGFEQDINGTILLSDKKTVYLYTNFKEHLIDSKKSKLINVIDLMTEDCLILGFSCGKVIFIFLRNLGAVSKNVMVISKKLISIEKCKFCDSCTIWSDGTHLYHMKFKFNISETCPVKITCLKIGKKFQNVCSVFSTEKYMLVNTLNNNFYQIKEVSINSIETKTSSCADELLLEIGTKSVELGLLLKKKKAEIEYFENLEITQNCNIKEFMILSNENNCLTLKSNFEKFISKIYWKIILQNNCKEKDSIEIFNFDSDLSKGVVAKIDSKLLLKGEVLVSLVGNFGVEFKLLFISLGKIGKPKKNIRESKCRKYLQKVVTVRNISTKVKALQNRIQRCVS